ncbi:hypothetical protein NYE40_08995 [Paenibacillus sp. FSL W8-1187]|uniref:hypothetical protein n=1 Tax=Paenibacillus sp. FSL W8-1187 TaxID=2975339 RepID=UPI0030DA6753
MQALLVVGGVVLLAFGAFGLFSEQWPAFAGGLFGGLLLMALSRIIDLLEELLRNASDAPYSREQLAKIMQRSRAFRLESELFEVHPNASGGNEYPLYYLNGEPYVRARAFLPYIKQVDTRYTFELPGREPVTLDRSSAYLQEVPLFEYQEQVVVRLKSLGLRTRPVGDAIKLEWLQPVGPHSQS